MRKATLFALTALAPLGMSPAQEHFAPRGERGSQFKVNAQVDAPRILAVRIHHDLCPHCKQLKPQFEALNASVLDVPVLLVTLDLSTPATQHQAALTAGALRLESLWTGDLSRIGTVTFLDAKSQNTLAEFRAGGDQTLDAVLRTALRAKRDGP